jgi:nucleotide-binding universal stress UspA family protein
VRTRAAAVTSKEDTKKTSSVNQLKTQVVVSPLSVTGSIVQYAERENIDLIVVGTRGRSGFKRLLLGSTASGIVTHAHCPVMVVR